MSNANEDAHVFDDASEVPPDLLAAWQGQVRSLADHTPVASEDNATSMLAQLRVIADDLARPAPRIAHNRLLTTGDHERPIGVVGDAIEEATTPDAASDAPALDVTALRHSIEESERRIESALAKSHERLASVFSHAFRDVPPAATVATPAASDASRESDLADARAQLGSVRQELESTRFQLDAARAENAQARDRMETEDAAALQRAIGMLSVLESLDDVVEALQSRGVDSASDGIGRFEREARAMARLVELEEIPTQGAVDPDLHEIVSTVGGATRAGAIVTVRQRGYTFRGRIVRRAQVVVSARGRG